MGEDVAEAQVLTEAVGKDVTRDRDPGREVKFLPLEQPTYRILAPYEGCNGCSAWQKTGGD